MLIRGLVALLSIGLVLALVGALIVNRLPSRWPGGPGLSPGERSKLTQSLGLLAVVIIVAALGLALPLLMG
ncbi:MAG: hypothetical protein M5U01_04400 [Ardenticatenaceae bacterium]|nr:hypothetical protein [Ardenticatenaceae bacterium]HBY97145.1 hypothetical protein [Chloroflexota bacterium]